MIPAKLEPDDRPHIYQGDTFRYTIQVGDEDEAGVFTAEDLTGCTVQSQVRTEDGSLVIALTCDEVLVMQNLNPGAGTMDGVAIGNRASDSARPIHIRVHEIVVYDRLLTADERSGLVRGLQRKWGLA